MVFFIIFTDALLCAAVIISEGSFVITVAIDFYLILLSFFCLSIRYFSVKQLIIFSSGGLRDISFFFSMVDYGDFARSIGGAYTVTYGFSTSVI
jgi:hypothetical protein